MIRKMKKLIYIIALVIIICGAMVTDNMEAKAQHSDYSEYGMLSYSSSNLNNSTCESSLTDSIYLNESSFRLYQFCIEGDYSASDIEVHFPDFISISESLSENDDRVHYYSVIVDPSTCTAGKKLEL